MPVGVPPPGGVALTVVFRVPEDSNGAGLIVLVSVSSVAAFSIVWVNDSDSLAKSLASPL